MHTPTLLLDTHVHPHRTHDPAFLFDSMTRHAARIAPRAHVGLVLLDGVGMAPWMDSWCAGRSAPAGWNMRVVDAVRGVVDAAGPDGQTLRVYAGRQIVCRERIELLAIGCRATEIADGLPLAQVADQVRDAGGLPVLAWGVGKWFGARGRIVNRWVEQANVGNSALGDTSLRPMGWPEPVAMRRARRRGLPVLAGSDTLSLPGDEVMAGRYATRMALDEDAPPDLDVLLAGLRSGQVKRNSVLGRRNGIPLFVRRQWHAMRARR